MKQISLLILLGFLSTSVFADQYDSMCELIKNRQIEYDKVLPLNIDDITTFIGFSSSCETKTIEYSYQTFTERSKLKVSDIKVKFIKFVNLQCNKGYPKNGWNVINYYYDKDMILIFKFVVNAEDCKRLLKLNNK